MALVHEFERTGNWLFRRRGWLPLLFFIPAILTIKFSDPSRYNFNPGIEMIFLGVSLLGQVIRAITIGHTPRRTSGRNVKGQVAEELNTTGIYSMLRHPLYLGNFFMFLGPVLFIRSEWFTIIFTLAYWLYYERIMFAEEQFLRKKFGKAYDEWSSEVPPIIPSFRNIKRAGLSFSLRNVLKREYNGFGNIFVTFAVLDFARNALVMKEYNLSSLWLWLLVFGLATWLILRILRKTTRLLNVPGR
jgi:protein-S-isoprenylcysteine O-methyltransferase Ste14